ncbi:MAG: IS1634 family transposase [Firmicutes bacterium]|jgi:transposase|nr:IS1634 family transposase [Bacillota bacterium]
MQTYDIKETGPGPIISNICRQLEIQKTINDVVPWDSKQCLLDPGTHVTALIINILCRRDPLYRIKEFYREQDVELLFGPGIKYDYFNDDALGKTLDKIYQAGPKKVFSAVTLKAQLKEGITYRVLHGDTTARLVYGDYEYKEDVLNITRGYNKEHRTDLKQFKVGLMVTEDGFPVFGEVLDGNLDDKTWNKQLIKNLPDYFNLEELKKIIYVADSALVTQDNLQAMGDDLQFISHLPENFNLASELIRAAFVKNKWLELGKISPGKKSASYKVQEFTRELYGRRYRFLVVYSNHLDKRKLNGLNSRLKKQKDTLEKAAQKFMKLTYACEADAKDALIRFLKDHRNNFYPLSGEVEKTTEKVKRKKSGRPPKDEEPDYREVWLVRVQLGELDEKAYEEEKKLASCFVLISNIFNSYTAYDLLKEYKEQSVVENRFRFVKNPIYVGPLWLQKIERLEAMSYVILMALAVYIILQRRVRLALEKEDEPLKVTGDKKSFNPTGNKILELFQPVKIIYIKEGGAVKRFLPERYYELSRALKMIGFEMEIFINPRSP